MSTKISHVDKENERTQFLIVSWMHKLKYEDLQ